MNGFMAIATVILTPYCLAAEAPRLVSDSDASLEPKFYQQYQAAPLPSASVKPATPPAPPKSPPSTPAATSELPSTADSSQITSLSNPIWVTPTQIAAPLETPSASVSVPDVSPIAPAPAQQPTPAAPTAPRDGNGLVVIATDVQIVGADAELQDLIRRTIQTQPGKGTNQTQLQQDVERILQTGLFAQANVTSRPNNQGIDVTFQVQPIVVRSLLLSGAQILTLPVANELFQPLLGQPISLTGLKQAVDRVNQWYAKNGYTLARVLTVEPSREGILTINVAEGLVGDVKIRFLNSQGQAVDENGKPIRGRTQEEFIRRQIKLKPGEYFREEVARDDLRRLAALGIFDSATVTFEGDARRADIVYNLVEGRSRGFNFGGGFNDDLGLFGTVSFQDNNFGGLAQRFNTSAQVGTRDIQFESRFRSPYRDTEPGMPGYGANLYRRQGLSRVFDDDIKLPNGSRIRERRLGAGINLEYPVAQGWLGNLGLNYVNVSIRDRDGSTFAKDEQGNPLTLSGKGVDDLYSVSFSATRDRRDNPLNPSTGSFASFGTEQYIPIGRGSVLGNRLLANYSQFFPVDLFNNPESEKFFPEIFAFNIQAGTVLGDLPPYNAFNLGGTNSVRGYREGDVASSRSFLQLSAEYRFPIYRFIGGVLFADFGTDLGTSDQVLGEPGVKRDKPGSGFGIGTGVRLNTPLGIIRADFGITDQGDTRFQFGFGQKF
jgi:outer membrane protein insertion porin family